MFLKHRDNGHLVEVVDSQELFDPFRSSIHGCYQNGEEKQDQEPFSKHDLVFMSGEELPRCWCDSDYRKAEVERRIH